MNYEVRIRVERKPPRTVVGKLFSVRCFQRKASALRVPAASGHTAVPKSRAKADRAWVNRRKDGTNHGIYQHLKPIKRKNYIQAAETDAP